MGGTREHRRGWPQGGASCIETRDARTHHTPGAIVGGQCGGAIIRGTPGQAQLLQPRDGALVQDTCALPGPGWPPAAAAAAAAQTGG